MNRLFLWLALLSVCVFFGGCIGSQSPSVTYYSLLTMEQLGDPVSVTDPAADLRIGIGPITIPDALKRDQLVTRDSRNVYQFDEFHRWAGVLEKDIAIVLGNNLEDLLGAEEIAFFPWMQYFKPTHRVVIDFIRFDGVLAREATLEARWAVADAEGQVTLARGKSVNRQTIEAGDYAGLLQAESQLLADLSREIAKAIDDLQKQN